MAMFMDLWVCESMEVWIFFLIDHILSPLGTGSVSCNSEAIRKVNIALTYSSLGYYPIFTEVFLMAAPTRKPYLTDGRVPRDNG